MQTFSAEKYEQTSFLESLVNVEGFFLQNFVDLFVLISCLADKKSYIFEFVGFSCTADTRNAVSMSTDIPVLVILYTV